MDLSFLKGTRIVVLDIETTGLSIQKDFVREFGVVEVVDGEIVRGNSTLFSGGKQSWDKGIPDSAVVGKPTFASKVKAVQSFLNGSIVMGHNVFSFDLPMIKRSMYEQNVSIIGDGQGGKIRTIDTLVLAKKYLHAPSNKLENLCMMFGIEHGQHRAYGDCLSCWNLFLKIVETTGIKDLNTFIREM